MGESSRFQHHDIRGAIQETIGQGECDYRDTSVFHGGHYRQQAVNAELAFDRSNLELQDEYRGAARNVTPGIAQKTATTLNQSTSCAMDETPSEIPQARTGETKTYQAGYEAALESIRRKMEQRGISNTLLSDTADECEPASYDGMGSFPPSQENMGNASEGLPKPGITTLERPLTALPETAVFTGGPDVWDVGQCSDRGVSDHIAVGAGGLQVRYPGSRDHSRRAMQRRAEKELVHHKKQCRGTKFTIRTDGGGNIITNKLRVTSLLKSLMGMYVDPNQVHFDDDDDQFVKVEKIIRDEYDFDPPLREGWFTEYMRKRMEKDRSIFKKHYDEFGKRHPRCPENRHPALMAWWASPTGRCKVKRITEMNVKRAVERRQLGVGGEQGHRQEDFDPVYIGSSGRNEPVCTANAAHLPMNVVPDSGNTTPERLRGVNVQPVKQVEDHNTKASRMCNDPQPGSSTVHVVLDECVNENGDVSQIISKLRGRNDYPELMEKL
ncbi:hypothetical protein M758_UG015800 [Ceratodon purpureus]|nr:hypothetical protein M758_UG015800 [Ceratodon purpureus]